jgi:hypothetical protein
MEDRPKLTLSQMMDLEDKLVFAFFDRKYRASIDGDVFHFRPVASEVLHDFFQPMED